MAAFTREPALAVWQAMKPLAELRARSNMPGISNILAEAETILFGLVLALVRRSEPGGSTLISDSTPKISPEPDGEDRPRRHRDEPWHHQPIDDR